MPKPDDLAAHAAEFDHKYARSLLECRVDCSELLTLVERGILAANRQPSTHPDGKHRDRKGRILHVTEEPHTFRVVDRKLWQEWIKAKVDQRDFNRAWRATPPAEGSN